MPGRNGHSNGNGDVASHTLRLLREIRSKMATKDDLAKVEATLDAKIESLDVKIERVETRLGRRIDVLGRIFKANHRVLGRRIRRLEIRTGVRSP